MVAKTAPRAQIWGFEAVFWECRCDYSHVPAVSGKYLVGTWQLTSSFETLLKPTSYLLASFETLTSEFQKLLVTCNP